MRMKKCMLIGLICLLSSQWMWGQHFPQMDARNLRERHGPFHSTPPLVGSKRGIRNEHGRLDFRPFLNERGFREDKRTYD